MTDDARKLIAYSFLVMFANDNTIDGQELAMLKKLAMEDGVIDADEKEVFSNLFDRISKEDIADAVWNEIEEFRDEHGID